jgi:hypothetical protein
MMFPKKFKTKASASRTWRKKCLKLWGEIIRLRAGGRCQRCGGEARDAHHIIPRGTHPNMGWFDLDNGIALCFQCHRVHGPHSLDVDEQIAFREWVRGWTARRNGGSYEVLKIRCQARGKIDLFAYTLLYRILRKEREKYDPTNRFV